MFKDKQCHIDDKIHINQVQGQEMKENDQIQLAPFGLLYKAQNPKCSFIIIMN